MKYHWLGSLLQPALQLLTGKNHSVPTRKQENALILNMKNLLWSKAALTLAVSALALTFSSELMANELIGDKLLGTYTGSECASREKNGNKINRCIPAQKSDRVTITRGKNGEIRLKTRMVFNHGHTWGIEGPAT